MFEIVRKLVSVLASSLLTTMASIEIKLVFYIVGPIFVINGFLLLKCVLYIYYLLQLGKNSTKIWALIDFDSKINTMTWFYTTKLGLEI